MCVTDAPGFTDRTTCVKVCGDYERGLSDLWSGSVTSKEKTHLEYPLHTLTHL